MAKKATSKRGRPKASSSVPHKPKPQSQSPKKSASQHVQSSPPLLAICAIVALLAFAAHQSGSLDTFFSIAGGDSAKEVRSAPTDDSLAGDVASPSVSPLPKLHTADICEPNVTHSVVFEELKHIRLWTIDSFLPEAQALALHSILNDAPVPDEGQDGSQWIYTNNRVDNRGRGTNEKVRSNEGVADRRARAQWARDLGSFAYSKNELNATSDTFKAIRALFKDSHTIRCLANLTGIDLVQVTDLFVSMYVEGDFLTTHQDYNLGTYAFVLQLTKEWDVDYGGNLKFSCNHHRTRPHLCKTSVPKFNSLTFFQTRPILVDHFVSEVTVAPEQNKRFAVTGWIASSSDEGFSTDTEDMRIQKGTY